MEEKAVIKVAVFGSKDRIAEFKQYLKSDSSATCISDSSDFKGINNIIRMQVYGITLSDNSCIRVPVWYIQDDEIDPIKRIKGCGAAGNIHLNSSDSLEMTVRVEQKSEEKQFSSRQKFSELIQYIYETCKN